MGDRKKQRPAEHYLFQDKEQDERFKRKLAQQANVFKNRLDVQDGLSKEDENLIENFCYENIINIDWYMRKKRKTRVEKRRLNILSITLLLFLLVIVLIVGYLAAFQIPESTNNGGEEKSGDLGIYRFLLILSSIIGFVVTIIATIHRSISAWVDKSKFLSQFHSTETELKNILFRLENKWRDDELSKDHELSREFKDDLIIATNNSKELVAAETALYFKAMANPTEVEFLPLIGKTPNSLGSVLETLKPLINKNAEAKREVQSAENHLLGLQTKLQRNDEELNALLAKKNKTYMESKRESQLKTEIDSLIEEAAKLELDLLEKKSRLRK